MKIRFVRSGGFAGVRLALDLDTSDLREEDASELAHLVEAARNTLTQAVPSRPRPDRFQYDLTIELDPSRIETHTLCEPDVPDSVRPLIEQLIAMARRRRA